MHPDGLSKWGPAPSISRETGDYRSFVTQLVCTKPDVNRYIGQVHWRADNGVAEGWFETADLTNYAIGDVIHVDIKLGD